MRPSREKQSWKPTELFIASNIANFAAVAIAICVGCISGCGPSESPAATVANANPTPFVDSVFTQCTVFENASSAPVRSLVQDEFQPNPRRSWLARNISFSQPL